MPLIFPENYHTLIERKETQKAIKFIKDNFQKLLGDRLNLDRVTAPLIVKGNVGINDDLNGVERKVDFTFKNMEGTGEVVQSLAKWKRMALAKYRYGLDEGIYTDMLALRRDDEVDNTHSVFVDQWDWERVISREDRTINFLKKTVNVIVECIADTKDLVNHRYFRLKTQTERNVFFVTSQELEDAYPDLTPKQRENEITKIHKTVFIMQIGGLLKSGTKHDGRAPDYDDWNLNGDILVWDDVLNCALELSSMGIRVDENSLYSQLVADGKTDRLAFPYHQGVIDSTLPLTIGGGIGQSRLCMYMLEKAHIGEVQSSVWPEEQVKELEKRNIFLL